MAYFEETYAVKTDGAAEKGMTVVFGEVRATVLTDRLIRVERQEDGEFCDLPTQTVYNRRLDKVKFKCNKSESMLKITTKSCVFNILFRSGKIKSVKLADGRTVSDFKKGNLKGTRRTLDMTFGAVKIGDGIISTGGAALLDDSNSLLLMPDGTVKPRPTEHRKNNSDIYCFAYGGDYTAAVADYYRLTGKTPLIPRFCLGNWWSRYKAYTQREYLDLMQRFEDEEIPLTVATVDMDWHWVDVAERFGKEMTYYKKPENLFDYIAGSYANLGWTGYSWNTELFPDYRDFLNKLHEKGLKVTLNVHPAGGVRFFETMYSDFARYMGIDPASKQPVEFDITNKKFIEGYFRFAHNTYEQEGVDFWWIDWQQGNKTAVKGLDPLWALNHYHSLDSMKNGKRPLILSRFAGNGSHRYPLGFSGDTGVSWATLKFQPYFTATASNIGYSWWSHDIGGHHLGKRDDELYARWVQFGVFSPIMRLHSTCNEFLGKEPWKFGFEANYIAKSFMHLRHRLIPYLYSMNRLTYSDGLPLIRPMYYGYPDCRQAYGVPNQYFFGTQLIAAPVTEKRSAETGMASVEVWLPEGRYTDVFTGRVYSGGKKITMCRDLSSIPVLAGEGAIIPLSAEKGNSCKNPKELEILIYSGNGSFTLYEDDGESLDFENGNFAETEMRAALNGGDLQFVVSAARGRAETLPEKRSYTFSFRDVSDCDKIEAEFNGVSAPYTARKRDNYLEVKVCGVSPLCELKVSVKGFSLRKNPSKKELLTELISKVQGGNEMKKKKYSRCLKDDFNGKIAAPKAVKNAIDEIMLMD